jgi:Glu-tRNA(Gln) amidotransferase subunit E-like FAD-binding protein
LAKQKLTIGENETEIDSLSEKEVEEIVGKTLDDRLSKLALPESLDADKLKTDILGEVEGLFEKHKTDPLDEDKLTKTIEKIFDNSLTKSLKGIGGNGGTKERQPGFLSKFLSE